MRQGVPVLVAAFILGGCGSAIEAACYKGEECGTGGMSGQQCVESTTAVMKRIREKNTPQCTQLADAFERLLGCQAGLSCEEIRQGLQAGRCATEQGEYLTAVYDGGSACLL
jgi:hypothetical protein